MLFPELLQGFHQGLGDVSHLDRRDRTCINGPAHWQTPWRFHKTQHIFHPFVFADSRAVRQDLTWLLGMWFGVWCMAERDTPKGCCYKSIIFPVLFCLMCINKVFTFHLHLCSAGCRHVCTCMTVLLSLLWLCTVMSSGSCLPFWSQSGTTPAITVRYWW